MNAVEIVYSSLINIKPMYDSSVIVEYSPVSIQELESNNRYNPYDTKYYYSIKEFKK